MFKRLREELFPGTGAFDARLGVHTNGTKSAFLQRLFTGKDSRRYQAIPEPWFNESARDIPRLPFIDMGSGKGRALILAHEAGFKKLIGVEHSRSLCRTARKNLAKLGITAEIYRGDAAIFEPPSEPCVFFFYNPFGEVTMRKVVAKIPQGSFVIYAAPQHVHLFDNFRLIKKSESWAVFTA